VAHVGGDRGVWLEAQELHPPRAEAPRQHLEARTLGSVADDHHRPLALHQGRGPHQRRDALLCGQAADEERPRAADPRGGIGVRRQEQVGIGA
jgi:hypothetical protein